MRRLIELWLLASVGVGLYAQQPPAGSEQLQQAIALHQSGDLDGAIRAYREYLAAQPDSIEARSNLGAALARAGRYEEAIAEYNRALARSSQNPALLLNLGLAYYKTARPAEAATRFESAISLAPQFKEQVTMLLASCYNSLGRYKESAALLAPLESSKSADPAFDYLYGTALIGDGRSAEGGVVIGRILGRGESAEGRLLEGTMKLQAYDYDGARVALEKSIALNGRLAGVHARLGELLMARGEIGPAAAAFTEELGLDPGDFVSNLNLGVLAKQDQDYDQARRYFDRALQSRPNDPGVRYQVANVDLATGHFEQARHALESLIGESPNFGEAHATLATVYYRLGRAADGDRERAMAEKLIDQQEVAQRGDRPR